MSGSIQTGQAVTVKTTYVHLRGRWQVAEGSRQVRINEIPFPLKKDAWKHLEHARITVMPMDVLISSFLLGKRQINEWRNKASNLRNRIKYFSL